MPIFFYWSLQWHLLWLASAPCSTGLSVLFAGGHLNPLRVTGGLGKISPGDGSSLGWCATTWDLCWPASPLAGVLSHDSFPRPLKCSALCYQPPCVTHRVDALSLAGSGLSERSRPPAVAVRSCSGFLDFTGKVPERTC